jgi:hypothetical protein
VQENDSAGQTAPELICSAPLSRGELAIDRQRIVGDPVACRALDRITLSDWRWSPPSAQVSA